LGVETLGVRAAACTRRLVVYKRPNRQQFLLMQEVLSVLLAL
jgi:hypothetical protein